MEGYFELHKEDLQRESGINELNRMMKILFDNVFGDGESVRDYYGYGSPENVIAASVGARYMRLDGGATTTLYVKTSGTGATGWTAK